MKRIADDLGVDVRDLAEALLVAPFLFAGLVVFMALLYAVVVP